ncbi:MAG TPA: glycosyltransferase family 2 protein [Bacillales bacterium]|nr:glycosyltransferase family 2 protein [Bacillales bacterium]
MNTNNLELSVVTPVYKGEPCLFELYERLKNTLSTLTDDFEIIFVNDASPDQSWNVICHLASIDDCVKGVDLSRNFGQHYAITAGLDYAKGLWTVVMDCDLQDQPEEIPKLYRKAQEGYDVVFGRRLERRDRFWKKWTSRLFYKIYDYFTDNKSDTTIANFSICSRKVIDGFRNLREQNRSFPLFIKWMGFRSASVNIEHSERPRGKSSYTFRKLVNLAIDGIVSQSNKPLKLSIKFGFMISFASFVYGLYLMYRYFFLFQPVPGWTSVMVSLYFIAGLVFANFGVLGLYIGKIFDEVKNRPLYIVQDTVGLEGEPKDTGVETKGGDVDDGRRQIHPVGRKSLRNRDVRSR